MTKWKLDTCYYWFMQSLYVDLWQNVHVDFYLCSVSRAGRQFLRLNCNCLNWYNLSWDHSPANAACGLKNVWSASPLYYLHKTANQLGNSCLWQCMNLRSFLSSVSKHLAIASMSGNVKVCEAGGSMSMWCCTLAFIALKV